MKCFWTALAVALVAGFAVTLAGCNDYGNTFQNNNGAFLSSLSPSNIPACLPNTTCPGFTTIPSCTPSGAATCKGFTLTVNGAGFVAKTKVQWNGNNCPVSASAGALCTTTVTTDATGAVLSISATIDAALVTKPGFASVNTISPAYGTGQNGLSNVVSFIVNNPPNPIPSVTSVSPTCAVSGNSLALTVAGSNFLTGSPDATQVSTLNWTLGQTQYQFNPSTTPAPTITSTQITVTVPAADIPMTGNASVTVSNPPSPPVPNVPGSVGSGGGSSNATSVTVQSAPCPVAAKAASATEAASVTEETPALSAEGRFVAYTAVQDGHSQIFLRDTCEGAPSGCQSHTALLSVSGDGSAASADSHAPSISSDGRYVAFSSAAGNLVDNAPSGRQIYLRDTCAGATDSCKPATHLISVDSNGALVGTESILPSVSSSGRFVAFLAVTPSHSANGASHEAKSSASSVNSGYRQVFIRDTCLGAANCTPKTTRISLEPGDGSENAGKPAGPVVDGHAQHVAVPGGNAATLFKRSVAVDDRVFLAITGNQP